MDHHDLTVYLSEYLKISYNESARLISNIDKMSKTKNNFIGLFDDIVNTAFVMSNKTETSRGVTIIAILCMLEMVISMEELGVTEDMVITGVSNDLGMSIEDLKIIFPIVVQISKLPSMNGGNKYF